MIVKDMACLRVLEACVDALALPGRRPGRREEGVNRISVVGVHHDETINRHASDRVEGADAIVDKGRC